MQDFRHLATLSAIQTWRWIGLDGRPLSPLLPYEGMKSQPVGCGACGEKAKVLIQTERRRAIGRWSGKIASNVTANTKKCHFRGWFLSLRGFWSETTGLPWKSNESYFFSKNGCIIVQLISMPKINLRVGFEPKISRVFRAGPSQGCLHCNP